MLTTETNTIFTDELFLTDTNSYNYKLLSWNLKIKALLHFLVCFSSDACICACGKEHTRIKQSFQIKTLPSCQRCSLHKPELQSFLSFCTHTLKPHKPVTCPAGDRLLRIPIFSGICDFNHLSLVSFLM